MKQALKSKFRDPQNIIAVGVTLISLCALVVSLMQTRIMQEERELLRAYSRASVWPSVELGASKGHNTENNNISQFSLVLTNSGVGPAIITDVKVTYKGKIANDWWEVFQLQGIPDSIEAYITNMNFNGRVLKVGETVEVLSLSDNLPLAQAFYERAADLSIEIYYESVYKEKWKYDGETTIELEHFDGLPPEEQFN